MTTKKLTKLIALYLPYILLGLVATNLGEAWRLAEGKELGDKIMAMMGTFPVAFVNPLPSLHPLDLLIGFSCGAGLRLAVYLRSKNAKKYPFCKEDIFVEVSDEIVEAFLLDKRAEAARDRKMFRYKAFYSLDCNDGIENAAIGWAQPSPEDYLIEKEELAEYEELIRRLYEAISSLPPMQARRVHARYMLGMKVKDIAAMEGITPSQAGKSIHAALRRLRRYFARQKWTVNL